MDRLERIRRQRDEYGSALDEAERRRDEYHREIVKLHRSGMSLREIAEGLGISHQRVHQIVSPLEERSTGRSGRRGAAGAAGVVVIGLLAAGIWLPRSHNPVTSRSSAAASPAPAARPANDPTSCLIRATGRSPFTLITGAAGCVRGALVVLDPQTGRILASVMDTKVRTTIDEQLQQDVQEYLHDLAQR